MAKIIAEQLLLYRRIEVLRRLRLKGIEKLELLNNVYLLRESSCLKICFSVGISNLNM